jgi:hypothetical protein
MSLPAVLVLPVAPWDWRFVPWVIPSWANVVEEVLLAYSADGQCFQCPECHELDMHELYAVALSELRRSGCDVPVRALAYDMPPRSAGDMAMPWRAAEPRLRNMASYCVRKGALILMPDVDELLLNPAETKQWLGGFIENRSLSLMGTYAIEVLRVQGDRALVVQDPREAPIGCTVPGQWEAARATTPPRVTGPARLLHWRPRGPVANAWRDYHLGDGCNAYANSLPVPEVGLTVDLQPWQSDARGWKTGRVVSLTMLGITAPKGVDP